MEPVKSPTDTVQEQVRQFYDGTGWQLLSQINGQSVYQNTLHEDLRPVSQEYISKCRLRILRHLKPSGKYLLDAGSGPIQYSEYLEYSQGYNYRVCLDISGEALREARMKIGAKGLYVIADAANLPFNPNAFDGIVSLHTLHHLPAQDQIKAYLEIYRVLAPESTATIVSGWLSPPIPRNLNKLIGLRKSLRRFLRGLLKRGEFGRTTESSSEDRTPTALGSGSDSQRGWVSAQGSTKRKRSMGTYVHKYNASWLKDALDGCVPYRISIWRSLDSGILRFYFHDRLAGRFLLRWVYRLEDAYPAFFGINGRYPLIIIAK